MKKLMIIMAALAVSTAFAAEVNLNKSVLGSGTPEYNAKGVENALVVDNAKNENNVLHAPQYMPNHPTAATIWPRVIEVPCKQDGGGLKCANYNWTPALGRGEYLFVTPKLVEPEKVVPIVSPPIVVKEIVTVPGPVREVFVEVPAKKKAE
jgi:hypothetical protein